MMRRAHMNDQFYGDLPFNHYNQPNLNVTNKTRFMAMILFLPTLQMLLTLAVMGTHPRDLHFGVVNHEMQDYDFCFNNLDSTGNLTNEMVEGRPSSCNFQMLSCSLITDLARSGTITLV